MRRHRRHTIYKKASDMTNTIDPAHDTERLSDQPLRDTPQTTTEESTEEVGFDTPIGDPPSRVGQGNPDNNPDSGGPIQPPSQQSHEQMLSDAENRTLRAYADLDNYKKRFDRELTRQRDVERERFLNSTLAIADNLRRALRVDNAESSPYREGLLSVMRQFDNLLRDFGVEPISAERGQLMDPNIHEAVTAISMPGAAHESIIEVLDPGYRMGERVLRPARVVVAKTDD